MTGLNRRRFLISAAAAASTAAARDFLAEAIDLHWSLPVFLGGCNLLREQFQAAGGRQSDLAKFAAAAVRTIVTAWAAGRISPPGRARSRWPVPTTGSLETQLRNIADALSAVRACARAHLITIAGQAAAPPAQRTLGVLLQISGNNHTIELSVVGPLPIWACGCGIRRCRTTTAGARRKKG
jgi:hypothetical protein